MPSQNTRVRKRLAESKRKKYAKIYSEIIHRKGPTFGRER